MVDRIDPYFERVEIIVENMLHDNENLSIDELLEKHCKNTLEYKLGNRAWKDFKIDVLKSLKMRK